MDEALEKAEGEIVVRLINSFAESDVLKQKLENYNILGILLIAKLCRKPWQDINNHDHRQHSKENGTVRKDNYINK